MTAAERPGCGPGMGSIVCHQATGHQNPVRTYSGRRRMVPSEAILFRDLPRHQVLQAAADALLDLVDGLNGQIEVGGDLLDGVASEDAVEDGDAPGFEATADGAHGPAVVVEHPLAVPDRVRHSGGFREVVTELQEAGALASLVAADGITDNAAEVASEAASTWVVLEPGHRAGEVHHHDLAHVLGVGRLQARLARVANDEISVALVEFAPGELVVSVTQTGEKRRSRQL